MLIGAAENWTPDRTAYRGNWDAYFDGDLGRRRRAKCEPDVSPDSIEKEHMLDIRRLLFGLTVAIREEVPDAAHLAEALDLDLSQSRVVNTRSVLAIHHAILDGNIEIDAAWGRPPHREICLVIAHSSLPYSKVKDETFGANQHIVPSRHSAGFGVVFEIGGWECGYTADSPDADVDFVFCREPKHLAHIADHGCKSSQDNPNLDGSVIKPD